MEKGEAMRKSNGSLRSILKTSGQFCMVAFASLFLVSFLGACNSNSESANDGTASSGANSFVRAKVAIPKGLTFTNEMLDFAGLEEGSDPKNYFKTSILKVLHSNTESPTVCTTGP